MKKYVTLKKNLLVRACTVVMACAQAVLWGSPAHSAELIWTGDFETGDFSQYKDHMYSPGTESKKELVKSPVRAGKYATALTIFDVKNDGGTYRAELKSKLKDSGRSIKFKWDGPEYWVGFSFLFKEWESDAFTFFQIHAPNEKKGDPCDFAGNTFSVWGSGSSDNNGVSDKIVVRVIENGGVSRGKGAGSNNSVVHSYPFPINEWQDYVVNFRLSTKGKGFYKIWKDGKAIYSKTNLTNVNHRDSCGNEIPSEKREHNGVHVGVYAPGTPGYRRIFYDEVRVAVGSDGYDLVAPGQADADSRGPLPEMEPVPSPPVIADQ